MFHADVYVSINGLCIVCVGLQVSFLLSPFSFSHQVVFFEVKLQDGVFDSSKDEADVLRVSGACEMGVDDLVTVWVQVHKHLQDELPTCLAVTLRTWMMERRLGFNFTLSMALKEYFTTRKMHFSSN